MVEDLRFEELPLEPFLVKDVPLSFLTDKKDPSIILSVCFPAFGQTSRKGPKGIVWWIAFWVRQEFRRPKVVCAGAQIAKRNKISALRTIVADSMLTYEAFPQVRSGLRTKKR
jgi:hypothetical protein